MDCRTQLGLLFLIIGSIINLIYGFIFSTSYFFIENYQAFRFAANFLTMSYIGAMLILVGAILFLIGRKEFGKNIRKMLSMHL